MRARAIRAVVGGVVLVLAVCGRGAAGPADVEIKLFQFQPGTVEVKAGSVVTWTNQDDIEHTVTSGEPEKRDGKFSTPLDGKGTRARVAFAQPGVFPYFCDRHQAMRGEIRVQ